MAKILIDSVGFETRAAIIAKGRMEHFEIERKENLSLAGNIYKGRVVRVLPNLNAAFLNIGESREVFLPLTDLYEFAPYQEEMAEEVTKKGTHSSRLKIKPKEEVLVQVVKNAIGTKAPKVTANHISLAGHLLVLLPQDETRRAISRRITSSTERERLLTTVSSFLPPEFGFIIRTSAERCSERVLRAEAERLRKTWEGIRLEFQKNAAPACLYVELRLHLRILRDYFTPEISEVLVDSPVVLRDCRRHLVQFGIDGRKVQLHQEKVPLFTKLGVDDTIEKALNRTVPLKGGGYLIIEETEALCAIDVNSGRTGGEDYRSMILRTNLLAAEEIAWQLRLRNLGGLIVVDFIDMDRGDDRRKVYQAFEEALEPDKARIKVLKVSRLGLVEMTRQRTRESLRDYLVDDCPACRGQGKILSVETTAGQLRRSLQIEFSSRRRFLGRYYPRKKTDVRVSPQFAQYLKENFSRFFPERFYQNGINLIPDPNLGPNQFKIEGENQ